MNNFSFQVLHVIDDVLVPLTTGSGSASEIYNPDALNFLTNANSFDIGSHRVRSFYQRVVLSKKESLFSADGYHTFFIPVEEGFKVFSFKFFSKSLFDLSSMCSLHLALSWLTKKLSTDMLFLTTSYLLLPLTWNILIQLKPSKIIWKSLQHSSPRMMESQQKVST